MASNNPLDDLMKAYDNAEKQQVERRTAICHATNPEALPSLILGNKETEILNFYIAGDLLSRVRTISPNILMEPAREFTTSSFLERKIIQLALGEYVKRLAKDLVDKFGVELVDREEFEQLINTLR